MFFPSFFLSFFLTEEQTKNLKIHARCLAPACFKILYQTRVSVHCQFIWASACNALSNVQPPGHRIFIILLLPLDSTHFTTPKKQNLCLMLNWRRKFTFFSFIEEGWSVSVISDVRTQRRSYAAFTLDETAKQKLHRIFGAVGEHRPLVIPSPSVQSN